MMKLTVFVGLPGSGKTYAAIRLEAETGAVRLSRDEIRVRLFDPPAFTDAEKAVVFRVMLVLAEYHMGLSKDVILDGMTFSKKAQRDAARRLAEKVGAEFELYECCCADDVALRRVQAQAGQHPASDRCEELFYRVKDYFEPVEPDEHAITLNT